MKVLFDTMQNLVLSYFLLLFLYVKLKSGKILFVVWEIIQLSVSDKNMTLVMFVFENI